MSIYIGDKKLDDWGAVTDYKISHPAPQTKFISVPGRDGSLDCSEALTGRMAYNDREIEINVLVSNFDREVYQDTVNEIANYCHGKRRKIVFPASPDHFFEGRLTVEEKKADQMHGNVTIAATVKPYAIKNSETIIEKSIALSEMITLANERMPTKLIIETDAEIGVVLWNGVELSLSSGKHTLHDPLLPEGESEVTITGTANIAISYQEGKL